MKKNNLFITLCGFVSIMTLSLCACSDDKEDINNSALIGSWQPIHVKGYEIYNGEKEEWNYTLSDDENDYVIKFNSDNSIDIYEYDEGELSLTGTGSYSLSGNKLTIKDDYAYTYTVESLNNSKMVLSITVQEGENKAYEETTWKKVND